MAEMRRRTNEHNITWLYASQCWKALREGKEFPPIPNYQTYESTDGISKGEKLVKETPIKPCKVVYQGTAYFE